jgi:hypothetical protein
MAEPGSAEGTLSFEQLAELPEQTDTIAQFLHKPHFITFVAAIGKVLSV